MKTQIDKTKEIQNLIKQIIEGEKHGGRVIYELTIRLDDYGPDIMNPILSKLHTHRAEGKLPNVGDSLGLSIFYLVDEATKFAKPQHAMQLAKMLLWPEIVLDGDDRAIRMKLVEALERIGNISIVPFLKEYAEKIKQVVYPDQKDIKYRGSYPTVEQLHKMDQQEIAEAIAACKRRPAQ